jgi:nucleoside diphosphate kinase
MVTPLEQVQNQIKQCIQDASAVENALTPNMSADILNQVKNGLNNVQNQLNTIVPKIDDGSSDTSSVLSDIQNNINTIQSNARTLYNQSPIANVRTQSHSGPSVALNTHCNDLVDEIKELISAAQSKQANSSSFDQQYKNQKILNAVYISLGIIGGIILVIVLIYFSPAIFTYISQLFSKSPKK